MPVTLPAMVRRAMRRLVELSVMMQTLEFAAPLAPVPMMTVGGVPYSPGGMGMMESGRVVPVAASGLPVGGVGLVCTESVRRVGVFAAVPFAVAAVEMPRMMVMSTGVPVMMAVRSPVAMSVPCGAVVRGGRPVRLIALSGAGGWNVLAALPLAVLQPAPQFLQAGPGAGAGGVVLVVAVILVGLGEMGIGLPFLLGAKLSCERQQCAE